MSRSQLYWDDLNVKLWENHNYYVLVRHVQQAGFQFLNFWRRSGPSLPCGSSGVSLGQQVTNGSATRSLTRSFLFSPINWNLWSSARHMLTPDLSLRDCFTEFFLRRGKYKDGMGVDSVWTVVTASITQLKRKLRLGGMTDCRTWHLLQEKTAVDYFFSFLRKSDIF